MIDDKKENLTNKVVYRELPNIPDSVKDGEKNIIDGRQKLWVRIVEYILTALGWIYMVLYVVFILYGALAITFDWYLPEIGMYDRNMILETREMIYVLCVIILIIILVMVSWRSYNAIKYGKLRRRKMPFNVSDKEVADFYHISEKKVKEYKESRVVTFDDNVI